MVFMPNIPYCSSLNYGYFFRVIKKISYWIPKDCFKPAHVRFSVYFVRLLLCFLSGFPLILNVYLSVWCIFLFPISFLESSLKLKFMIYRSSFQSLREKHHQTALKWNRNEIEMKSKWNRNKIHEIDRYNFFYWFKWILILLFLILRLLMIFSILKLLFPLLLFLLFSFIVIIPLCSID